ncbi:MAG TPA: hypothetical protein VGR21_04180, partial [Cryptosporangiaceae bacterium]|nr:hypothetical protein [Cryptosporangiaceae bacterium]
MAWEFSDDVEAYAERVWDLLTATPAENTVALTVVDNVRAGRQRSTGPMLFGWYAAGPTAGAVSMTPPYELLLAFVPDEGVDELVAAIRDRLPDLRGIHAEDTTAERFTAAWTAAGPLRATTKHRLRLYALDTLLQPTRSEGRARQAGEADYDVALSWFTEFQREVDAGPTANVASV